MMVELRGDIRFHLLFGLLLRIPIRVSSLRTGGSSLLTHSAPYDRTHHELERTVDILRSIPVEVPRKRAELFLSDNDSLEADEVLRSVKNDSGSRKYAVICPTAAKNIKQWKPERWSATAQYINERYGLDVFVTGGPDDVDSCAEIALNAGKGIFSLAGRTSLKQIASILQRATIVLGVDGGTLHIASAFDVPIIALFGPTRQEEFKPYSPSTIVVDLNRCVCDKDIHLSCAVANDGLAQCMDLVDVRKMTTVIDTVLSASRKI